MMTCVSLYTTIVLIHVPVFFMRQRSGLYCLWPSLVSGNDAIVSGTNMLWLGQFLE